MLSQRSVDQAGTEAELSEDSGGSGCARLKAELVNIYLMILDHVSVRKDQRNYGRTVLKFAQLGGVIIEMSTNREVQRKKICSADHKEIGNKIMNNPRTQVNK